MFTGIIKETGRIFSINRFDKIVKIGVLCPVIFESVRISDSVAINGVCLTVVNKERNILYFQIVDSTWKMTGLKRLKINDLVNCEPALKVGDSLGGHFVLGHIDSETKINRILHRGGFWEMQFDLPAAFSKNIVNNGSIGIDGISLTVKQINARDFNVHIIPFTFEHTVLKHKKIGSWVNVEFDYLMKKK